MLIFKLTSRWQHYHDQIHSCTSPGHAITWDNTNAAFVDWGGQCPSSVACAAYRFHIADPIPFQQSIVVDMDHGYTNQVQTDYSSVAYWYQAEPHAAFPPLPPLAERLPTPAGQNALQFALLTSPAWVPATLVGLKWLRKVMGNRD